MLTLNIVECVSQKTERELGNLMAESVSLLMQIWLEAPCTCGAGGPDAWYYDVPTTDICLAEERTRRPHVEGCAVRQSYLLLSKHGLTVDSRQQKADGGSDAR